MVGIFSEYSSEFLKIFAVTTLIFFAIPILVAPLTWARGFRWRIDAQPHLALYFGRCLGAFIVTISSGAWYVAGHPELQPFYFYILIALLAFMAVVHAVGAIQKVQPWTETAEIALWCLLVVLGLGFFPSTLNSAGIVS